jgi:hypothetical protein
LLAVLYVPAVVAVAAVLLVWRKTGIPIRVFFIDPVAEFDAPMYIGLFSNLGVLLWCASAAVCLFGGWLLMRAPGRREVAWFLVCAGLLTGFLQVDDLYLLHEEVLPDHCHVPQMLVFAGYDLLFLSFLVGFRRVLHTTDHLLLFLAFGFLGLSAFIDLFVTPEEFFIAGTVPGRHLVEDGFKLLGVVTWAAFFIRTSMQQVGASFSAAGRSGLP